MKKLSGTIFEGAMNFRPEARVPGSAGTAPRRPYLHFLGILLLLGPCAEAMAQGYVERYYVPEQHVRWHIDTGYAATTGSISDLLDGGWTIGGGFSWQPDFRTPLALRVDLNYSHFSATRQLISLNEALDQTQIDNGYGEIVDFTVDGEYRMPLSPYVTAFALGGIGVGHRRIALTQTVAVGGYFCDYWFGYCAYGLFPGDVVVASDDTTRFEWNAGLGLDFALGGGETFFVEARFTRLQTQQPTDFIPIRVGLRF